jgi:catechol 2,3-dioxygenase-like lactoylglutathione lyase family enzyme
MLKFICPLIVVDNIIKSRYFYEHVLGQEVKFDFGANITYKGDFAIHHKTHFQQLLGEPTDYPVIHRAHYGELYFESDTIEDMFKQLKQNSVTFIHELQEQPRGQRVMRFYDPDGHIIEIGEPMAIVVLRFYQQGLSIQEICKKSAMPVAFIEQVIKEKPGII